VQDDSGLKKPLTDSFIYTFFQNLLGTKKCQRWLADNVWKLRGGERVVDIGCGPGIMLDFLPNEVAYWGFDISETYITTARQRFGDKGEFLVGTAIDFLNHYPDLVNTIDLINCLGLLHHVDDKDAINILEVAKCLLGPQGRMICVEPVFLARHSRISKWFISQDRGQNVRQEQAWKKLSSKVFHVFSTQIVTGLNNIPYAHIIIECRT